MAEENIENDCPECGTQNLFFKAKDICCSKCDKVIFREASREEAMSAQENWLKKKSKTKSPVC